MEAQATVIIWVGYIKGQFNLSDLFTNKTMLWNTRHNLVDEMFSKIASPIGDIGKAQVHFHMGAYKYLPHYKVPDICATENTPPILSSMYVDLSPTSFGFSISYHLRDWSKFNLKSAQQDWTR